MAGGLADKIKATHRDDPRFRAAFDSFFALCRSALNPDIRQAAVDEILLRRLLPERLIA